VIPFPKAVIPACFKRESRQIRILTEEEDCGRIGSDRAAQLNQNFPDKIFLILADKETFSLRRIERFERLQRSSIDEAID